MKKIGMLLLIPAFAMTMEQPKEPLMNNFTPSQEAQKLIERFDSPVLSLDSTGDFLLDTMQGGCFYAGYVLIMPDRLKSAIIRQQPVLEALLTLASPTSMRSPKHDWINTLFCQAILDENTSAMNFFLKNGLRINDKRVNCGLVRPLTFAVTKGKIDATQLLLEHGADTTNSGYEGKNMFDILNIMQSRQKSPQDDAKIEAFKQIEALLLEYAQPPR